MGEWGFYIIKFYYFEKVLKCIVSSGTSKKGKCIKLNGTEGVFVDVKRAGKQENRSSWKSLRGMDACNM